MIFCPNCSNILDYIKSSTVLSEKIIIKKVSELFKLIDSSSDLTIYKAEFDKNEILENKKYSKLNDNTKKQINKLFEQPTQLITPAEYKCINCGYNKLITETVRLYYNCIDNNNNALFIKSIEENELLCSDPLLPHTKDYVCKNDNCITHKQSNLKDSIFYKDNISYKVNYICCMCFHSW